MAELSISASAFLFLQELSNNDNRIIDRNKNRFIYYNVLFLFIMYCLKMRPLSSKFLNWSYEAAAGESNTILPSGVFSKAKSMIL